MLWCLLFLSICSDAPKNTTVMASPSASVLLGTSVILSCTSDANPAVLNYTWFTKNGEQIGTRNHLIIKNTDESHQGSYHCRAQNQHGDQNSSIDLNLQCKERDMGVAFYDGISVLEYKPGLGQLRVWMLLSDWFIKRWRSWFLSLSLADAPQVSSSSSCNLIHDWLVCFCEVRGNPSPRLDWRLSGETLPSSEAMWVESINDTRVRSFIPLHQSYSDDLSTLQCVGTNKLGIDTHILDPLILVNPYIHLK